MMITSPETWPMMEAMSQHVSLTANEGRQMKQTATYSDSRQWADLWAQTLRDRGEGIEASGGQLRLESCALIIVIVPLPTLAPKQDGAPDSWSPPRI